MTSEDPDPEIEDALKLASSIGLAVTGRDGYVYLALPGTLKMTPDDARLIAKLLRKHALLAEPQATPGEVAHLRQAERAAQVMASEVESLTPRGWRFVIVLASEGEGGFATWVGNCGRETTAELLRELLAKFDARTEDDLEYQKRQANRRPK